VDIEKISRRMKALSESDRFSGCVLLKDQNRNTILSFSCGYASKEYEIKNTLDTKFNIASVGKSITGVAIAKLMECKIINPSDIIAEHIDLKNTVFDKITIEQLLTHTSGLGDYFPQVYSSAYTKTYENLEDYAEIVEQASLEYPPGEKWAYSNLGYLVLGILIEKLTGMPYDAYITENVFVPANMLDSGFWLYNETVKNRATGYYYDEEKQIWRSRAVMPVLRGIPAGGCLSTVDDLSRFVGALVNNVLLSDFYTRKVLTPKPGLNAPSYGYGFFISDEKISHSGDGTGVSAHLTYYTSCGYTLAVLSNYSNGINEVVEIVDRELM